MIAARSCATNARSWRSIHLRRSTVSTVMGSASMQKQTPPTVGGSKSGHVHESIRLFMKHPRKLRPLSGTFSEQRRYVGRYCHKSEEGNDAQNTRRANGCW